MRSFYKLFKDSPARRAGYQKITGSKLFSLKFCTGKWVESVRVAQKPLEVYGNLKIYVKESKLSENVTVNAILDAVSKSLMPAWI